MNIMQMYLILYLVDKDGVMVVHVGGTYGDKKLKIDRW